MIENWETEKERIGQHLRDNPPPDAGGEYRNTAGLLSYLATLRKPEIAKTARWIKMHYVNTESLMVQIRKIHHSAKK